MCLGDLKIEQPNSTGSAVSGCRHFGTVSTRFECIWSLREGQTKPTSFVWVTGAQF